MKKTSKPLRESSVFSNATESMMRISPDLIAVLHPSDDPQLVDDEWKVFRADGNVDTGFTVQIGQAGYFYVNEHRNEERGLIMVAHSEHTKLADAFREAIDLIGRQHVLLAVELVDGGNLQAPKFRWVCSCGEKGIPVGSHAIPGEDWARGAFKHHVSRINYNAKGAS